MRTKRIPECDCGSQTNLISVGRVLICQRCRDLEKQSNYLVIATNRRLHNHDIETDYQDTIERSTCADVRRACNRFLQSRGIQFSKFNTFSN